VELPAEVVEDAKKRLRRAVGQVQAVERMLEEGRDCRDVLVQLLAATKALERARLRLGAAGLAWCAQHPERAAEEGCTFEALERVFTRLA
jgi:DNA-binding FrmR family transcriptional regulator